MSQPACFLSAAAVDQNLPHRAIALAADWVSIGDAARDSRASFARCHIRTASRRNGPHQVHGPAVGLLSATGLSVVSWVPSTAMESNQAAFSYAELGRALERRRRQAERRAQAVVAHVGDAGDIFARYGVTKAILFGSHARLSPRADSDVDLLVYGLDEGRFFNLASELEERLGRTVDLHTSAERPELVGRAVRTGIIVYEYK